MSEEGGGEGPGWRRLPEADGAGAGSLPVKTCQSEQESSMYCEKVVRTSSAGRI